jgi:hypothetical protein
LLSEVATTEGRVNPIEENTREVSLCFQKPCLLDERRDRRDSLLFS